MFSWLSRPPHNRPSLGGATGAAAADPHRSLAHGPEVSGWALRAARADDYERLMRLYDRLSPQTIYYRLFLPAPHGPEWAARFAALTLREAASGALGGGAFVVVSRDQSEIVGAGQYAPGDEPASPPADKGAVAELALVVEDAWQGHGAGSRLLRALVRASRADGYHAVSCHVLAENFRAQRFVTSRLTDVAAHVQDGGYAYRARLDAQSIGD